MPRSDCDTEATPCKVGCSQLRTLFLPCCSHLLYFYAMLLNPSVRPNPRSSSRPLVPALCAPRPPPPANAIIADPGGACGPRHDAMCPGSQCCSMHEYCGTTAGGWGHLQHYAVGSMLPPILNVAIWLSDGSMGTWDKLLPSPPTRISFCHSHTLQSLTPFAEHCEVSSGCMEKWGTCKDTGKASSSSSNGAAAPPPAAAAAASPAGGGIPPDRIATIVGAT